MRIFFSKKNQRCNRIFRSSLILPAFLTATSYKLDSWTVDVTTNQHKLDSNSFDASNVLSFEFNFRFSFIKYYNDLQMMTINRKCVVHACCEQNRPQKFISFFCKSNLSLMLFTDNRSVCTDFSTHEIGWWAGWLMWNGRGYQLIVL